MARPRLRRRHLFRRPPPPKLHGRFVELEITANDAFHGLAGRGSAGVHHLGQLVVLGNDPVDPHLASELDFFCGLLVRGVGGGDDQAVVALAQHNHPQCLTKFRIQQIPGQSLNIDGLHVQHRCPESRGHGVGQIGGGHRARTGELRDEAGSTGLGFAVQLLGRALT